MDDLVVFCDRDSLEAGLLAEFIQSRRVPQSLFYLMNGADSFYSYRNLEVDQIPWREEYEFFFIHPPVSLDEESEHRLHQSGVWQCASREATAQTPSPRWF